jgi:hypothetical protein
VAGAAHDLLDRGALLGNDRIDLFAMQVALVLDPLGGREQVGVDRHGTDRSPDLPHGFADGVEERATGILHEVPSVGDLGSFRQGLRDRHGVAATTIPGDDFDLLLVRKPSLSGRRLSVG